jgi:hypothetical protein
MLISGGSGPFIKATRRITEHTRTLSSILQITAGLMRRCCHKSGNRVEPGPQLTAPGIY